MSYLPTDEEYLDQLHERFKDDEWIAAQERYSRPEDIVSAVEAYVAEGSFRDNQRDDLIEAVREATTPSLYFRGKFVGFLRSVALKAAEEYIERLKNIALNHLEGDCSLSLTLEPAGELIFFTNSEKQEFEADEFAFNHYRKIGHRPDDIALGCGLLFHFFNLCEKISPPKIRTHPPALSRWRRIRDMAELSQYPQSWANYLDGEFAIVSRGLR